MNPIHILLQESKTNRTISKRQTRRDEWKNFVCCFARCVSPQQTPSFVTTLNTYDHTTMTKYPSRPCNSKVYGQPWRHDEVESRCQSMYTHWSQLKSVWKKKKKDFQSYCRAWMYQCLVITCVVSSMSRDEIQSHYTSTLKTKYIYTDYF